MHYIWKPGRTPHQRHLCDFEPEWSHKQKQGSRGGAGLGGESNSLISSALSGVEWASVSCLLGFGRWETAGQRERRAQVWAFGVLSAGRTEGGHRADRCSLPSFCVADFMSVSAACSSFRPPSLPSFLPFLSVLRREMPHKLLIEKWITDPCKQTIF